MPANVPHRLPLSEALERLEITQFFQLRVFPISPVPLNSRGSGTIRLGCFRDEDLILGFFQLFPLLQHSSNPSLH
jgi:hypothetical protein